MLASRFFTLVGVCALASAAQANLVINGSFEEGRNMPASFRQVNAISADITGWTVKAGSVDWIGTYWNASDGARSLDLSGSGKGLIVSQNVNTTVGTQYLLTFDMAGNPAGGPVVKELDVVLNNAVAGTFQFDTTGKTRPGGMGWVQKSVLFTATSNSTAIGFQSKTDTAYGPALDNVRLVAVVPAPGAALLAFIGLPIVAWARRKLA